MLLDKLNLLASATALNTGAANTYLIGSQIDLGDARDIGNAGKPLWFVLQVTTAVDSSGDGVTLAFHLASDATAAVHVSTGTRHFSTPVFTQAQLVAGFRWMIQLPTEGLVYEQFLGLLQTTAVEAVTAGAVTVALTIDPPVHKLYPEGLN